MSSLAIYLNCASNKHTHKLSLRTFRYTYLSCITFKLGTLVTLMEIEITLRGGITIGILLIVIDFTHDIG